MKNHQHKFKQYLEIFIVSAFINSGNRRGQDKVLPVWGFVWIGLVQPEHHTLTLPTGSVQEAARCKAFAGGHERIQPMCWRVRGNECLF